MEFLVLCDGEAFHGPRFAFGDCSQRIVDDVATADGYYALVRYSETEIREGTALTHFLACLPKLTTERWS